MAMKSSLHSIGLAISELLLDGPRTDDELVDALEERGFELGDEPLDTVHDAFDDERIEIIGDRFVLLGWAFERLTLCTDISADNDDALVLKGTLAILVDHPEESLTIVGFDGAPLGWVHFDEGELGFDDVLHGPPGWLDHVAGRRALLTVDEGTLVVTADDRQIVSDGDIAAAFRRAFDSEVAETAGGRDGASEMPAFTDVSSTMLRMIVDDHSLTTRRIIPPLDVLVPDAGLQLRDDLLADAGTDWTDVWGWQGARRISRAYGITHDDATAVTYLVGAGRGYLDDGFITDHPDERENAAMFMALMLLAPEICRAFIGEWRAKGLTDEQLLAYMAFIIDEIGGGSGTSGPEYVSAMALEAVGRTDDAIAALERAVAAEAHPAACIALAGFAADRGDAPGAARLLRQGRIDEDDQGPGGLLWAELQPYLQRPKATAGRNDPCPCGSGRKYKACHQDKELHSPALRAAWVHRKAMRYARTHARELHTEHVAAAVAEAGGGYQLLLALIDSELMLDVTLHEGGVWQEFLATRSHLLPDDEAMIAAQWALVDRSIFEMEEQRGSGWLVRDVRTGDRSFLDQVRGEALHRGALVLGRPLPVDGELRAIGGMVPMGRALLDHAIRTLDEAQAESVSALIGSCLRPPQMSNTDGHRLRFHTLAWQIGDDDAAIAALHAAGFQGTADELSLVRDSQNQSDTVIAFGSVTGHRLVLEVNSDDRAEEMVTLVSSSLPQASLVEHDVRELSEVMDAGGPNAIPRPANGHVLPLLDPDSMDEGTDRDAVMREIMTMMEQRWCEEPVPALRGLTPREALLDPVARFDLERLLDSFPDHDSWNGMSPRRLRALLDL